jgi:hypothetical protein
MHTAKCIIRYGAESSDPNNKKYGGRPTEIEITEFYHECVDANDEINIYFWVTNPTETLTLEGENRIIIDVAAIALATKGDWTT